MDLTPKDSSYADSLSYVELNVKTNFSFLSGASDAREYIQRAMELKMPALGICDMNGVYALPRAFEKIKEAIDSVSAVGKPMHPSFKLICGAEITMQEGFSIQLLAQNRRGWGLLCRLLTHTHRHKNTSGSQLSLEDLSWLIKRFGQDRNLQNPAEKMGLFCLACAEQPVPGEALKNLFSPSQMAITLCRYLDGRDQERTEKALKLSEQLGLMLVASNDCYYHHPQRQRLQDVLTAVREKTTLDKAGFLLFKNAERYLKSPMQMQLLFSDLPEAILNTQKIADSCTFCLSELKYTYPKEAVPPGESASSYLQKLVLTGAKRRYRGVIDEKVDAQIRRELEFFKKRGEEDYFLTMYDILQEARDKGIVFQGRGSAASSVICYALGITAVDPISTDLLFDRFANDARKDPPDIDVDFEHERREEVIQGIFNKYGRDRAAMVAAVHTYQEDSAYRDFAKVLGVSIQQLKAKEIKERFKELAGPALWHRQAWVEELVEEVRDFPRHIGTHTGGFVITHEPLIETVPIEPAAMDGRTIVQWDKHDLETLGMMKIDILSIGFLTVLKKATALIGMNWEDIPVQDVKTYQMIHRAETAGCFQIESRAQMNSLPRTKPSTPYQMTVQVALIRPSVSKGGMNRAYLEGKKKYEQKRFESSGNLELDRILSRTYGVPIFPDQIMQIALRVCGFTSTEADQLRRSLGKERSASSVNDQAKKLFTSLFEAGVKEPICQEILARTQGFSSYGFPEGHAASYGILAFKSAYLKAHYPAEYLCALINSQPMGFYSVDFLIREAERNSGVKVKLLDVNQSVWEAELIDAKTLRMGFCNLKGIKKRDVEALIETRKAKPFVHMEDFLQRTFFDKQIIQRLALANAFSCFGLDRRHSYWHSQVFKNLFSTVGKQRSLFDQDFTMAKATDLFNKPKESENILLDFHNLGYSLTGHLLREMRLERPELPPLNSKALAGLKDKSPVECAGLLIVAQKPPAAKGFCFLTLEDEFGTLELVLNPDVYAQHKDLIWKTRYLIVQGVLQKSAKQCTILARHLSRFA